MYFSRYMAPGPGTFEKRDLVKQFYRQPLHQINLTKLTGYNYYTGQRRACGKIKQNSTNFELLLRNLPSRKAGMIHQKDPLHLPP